MKLASTGGMQKLRVIVASAARDHTRIVIYMIFIFFKNFFYNVYTSLCVVDNFRSVCFCGAVENSCSVT